MSRSVKLDTESLRAAQARAQQADRIGTRHGPTTLNPDCRDGKHAACAGDGWETLTDEPATCPCECH